MALQPQQGPQPQAVHCYAEDWSLTFHNSHVSEGNSPDLVKILAFGKHKDL